MPQTLSLESMWRGIELTSATTGCHLCKGAVTAVTLAAKGSWAAGALPAVGCT